MKDLKKNLITQLNVAISFMDDYHFTNIVKINLKIYLIILGKIKTCNSTKNEFILCIENKIVKYLINAFSN